VKVVLFGATGMVGQGVLRECLLDPDVESVLAVVRNASLPQHEHGRSPPTRISSPSGKTPTPTPTSPS
jgi:dihydrodipicolinate reductase